MTNTTTPAANDSAKPPVAKLRLGLINANIWQRQTDDYSFYAVSFERRYRDQQGNWQSTHSYNTEDLLLLSKLADQAHTEICRLQTAGSD